MYSPEGHDADTIYRESQCKPLEWASFRPEELEVEETRQNERDDGAACRSYKTKDYEISAMTKRSHAPISSSSTSMAMINPKTSIPMVIRPNFHTGMSATRRRRRLPIISGCGIKGSSSES